jgi:phosphoglycolate phosphatase
VTPAALLFDLDGTLTDPRPGIVRSLRHALEQLARPCPSDDALAPFIGPPLRGTFATLLATSDQALIERAMSLYRERFTSVGLHDNAVYEGIPAMLEAVRRAGHRPFVATSKPAVFAERIVRHFALDGHFHGVYGPELDGRFDDKAELLAHLLATERLVADRVVMVGDREADIVAARVNGLRAIGVLWGYGTRDELLGADALCRAPADLPGCVARVLDRRDP